MALTRSLTDELARARSLVSQTQAQGSVPFAGSSFDAGRSLPVGATTPPPAPTSLPPKPTSPTDDDLNSLIRSELLNALNRTKTAQTTRDTFLAAQGAPRQSIATDLSSAGINPSYQTATGALAGRSEQFQQPVEMSEKTVTERLRMLDTLRETAKSLMPDKPDTQIITESDNQGNVTAVTVDKNTGRIISQKSLGKIGKDTSASSVDGKNLNVDQSKARQFAISAENADNILNSSKYDLGNVEIAWTPNMFKSSDRQVFEQSARAFVNATLRRESGATITDDEFKNKYRELIPQAGDGTDVIANKKIARQLAVKSIKEAGLLPAGEVSNSGQTGGNIITAPDGTRVEIID